MVCWFSCQIKITNNGSSAFEDWTLSFDFSRNQTITDSWCADFTQVGPSVSAKCLAWNRILNSGDSVTIRFNANYSESNDIPAEFIITSGSNTNNPPTASITNPIEGEEFFEGADITITVNAADTDGTFTSVEFFAGSTSLGIDSSVPYSVTWNNAAAGNHVLTAEAIDSEGTISVVEFYEGEIKLGEDSTAPYSYTWTNAVENMYNLKVIAYDDKDLPGESAPITITVGVQGDYNYGEALQKSIWFYDV